MKGDTNIHQARGTDLIPVDFHGDALECLPGENGKMWVVLRPICAGIGIDPDSQRRRLSDDKRSPWACTAIMTARDTGGRNQDAFCIDLDSLPMWLGSIEAGRVKEEIRPRLIRYQKECAKALADRFLRPAAQPTPSFDLARFVGEQVNLMREMTAAVVEMRRSLQPAPAQPAPVAKPQPAPEKPASPDLRHVSPIRQGLDKFMHQITRDMLPIGHTGKDFQKQFRENHKLLRSKFYLKTTIHLDFERGRLGLKSCPAAAEQLGKIGELYDLARTLFGVGDLP